jgi:hypothetical protein
VSKARHRLRPEHQPKSNQVFVGCPWHSVRPKYEQIIQRLKKKYPISYVIIGREADQDAKDLLESIKEALERSSYAIFDATGGNPNVSLEFGLAEALDIPRAIYLNARKSTPRPASDSPIIADLAGKKRNHYKQVGGLGQLLEAQARGHNFTKRFDAALRRRSGTALLPGAKRLRSLALKLIHSLDGRSGISSKEFAAALAADPARYNREEIDQTIQLLKRSRILQIAAGPAARVTIRSEPGGRSPTRTRPLGRRPGPGARHARHKGGPITPQAASGEGQAAPAVAVGPASVERVAAGYERSLAIEASDSSGIPLLWELIASHSKHGVLQRNTELLAAARRAAIVPLDFPSGLGTGTGPAPKSTEHGIRYELLLSGSRILEHWSLRKDGAFYCARSPDPSEADGRHLFVDNLIRRAALFLLFLKRLYVELGVHAEAVISIDLRLRGIGDKTLAVKQGVEGLTSIESGPTQETNALAQIRPRLGDLNGELATRVSELLSPVLELFGFARVPEPSYASLIRDFRGHYQL